MLIHFKTKDPCLGVGGRERVVIGNKTKCESSGKQAS